MSLKPWLLALALPLAAQAGFPVAFEGRWEAEGASPGVTLSVQVSLYATASGGTPLATEAVPVEVDAAGRFRTELQMLADPAPELLRGRRWLELQPETGGALDPRLELLPARSAYRAETAEAVWRQFEKPAPLGPTPEESGRALAQNLGGLDCEDCLGGGGSGGGVGRLGRGTYDVGNRTLTFSGSTILQGAGIGRTIIRGSGANLLEMSEVATQDSWIRDLTLVRDPGPNGYVVYGVGLAQGVRFQRVELRSEEPGALVFGGLGAGTLFEDCRLSSAYAIGISHLGEDVTFRRSELVTTGGTTGFAMRSTGGHVAFVDSRFEGVGSAVHMTSDQATLEVRSSELITSGPELLSVDLADSFEVRDSRLRNTGGGEVLDQPASGSGRITRSQLEGTCSVGMGLSTTCVLCYDEALSPRGCP